MLAGIPTTSRGMLVAFKKSRCRKYASLCRKFIHLTPEVSSSICTINDAGAGADADMMASISRAKKAMVTGIYSRLEIFSVLVSIRLASSSLPIRLGRPLPVYPC